MTNQAHGKTILALILGSTLVAFSVATAGSAKVSWDPNTEEDLSGYKIYYGLGSKSYSDVVDVGNVTSITLNALDVDRTYYFSVTAYDLAGNESVFSEEVSATITTSDDNGDATTDTVAPEVVAVVPRGETQIDVFFSEAVDQASAENPANYSISNGVSIIGAVMDADPTVVHLITTAQTKGLDHVLAVRNVQDVNGNALAQENVRTYNIPDPAQDAQAPELLYVAVKSGTLLEVIFNESIRFAEAEDLSNYAINNGISISAARLRTNQSIVELTTSDHVPGTSYTLSVVNVRDLAGNTIVQNSNFSYETTKAEESSDAVAPSLSNVNVRGETQVDLGFSEPVARSSAENPLNYFINKNIEIKGAILSENQTTVHLITSGHEYSVQYTVVVSNVEDLAGNGVSENNSGSYTLTGDDAISDDTGIQTPTSFSLFQNFPNPFNPETEIRFYLDEDRRVELRIYNQLGQEVRSLIKDTMGPGLHTVVWDGRNADDKEVPSGVYIYSLEVTREALRGDLLVNVSIERRVKRMTLIR
jgi:hypothetical protein